MLKAIIFDFDGVIGDTYDLNFQISKMLSPHITEQDFQDHHNGNVFESPKKLFKSEEVALFFEKQKELFTKAHFFEVGEILHILSKKYVLFIVSSTKDSNIEHFLKLGGYDHFFREILGSTKHRSKVEKFKMIFQQYNLNSNQCIFVTDTIGDIIEARDINLKTIAVTWGYHPRNLIEKEKPSAIIDAPSELIGSITRLDLSKKRIAIVADWLIDFAGAELVISHLLEIFPEADIYTSVCFMKHPMLVGRRVYTSWLQKIPFLNRRHKLAGILRPFAFRSFDLSGYDLVICSSSAESKQVAMGRWNHSSHPDEGRIQEKGPEILDSSQAQNDGNQKLGTLNFESGSGKPQVFVYCHTPTRYYWSHFEEYKNMMEFGFFNPLAKGVLNLLINWLRKLDYTAAQKVDCFIANSRNTKERIRKYYNRESEVIYPGIGQSSIAESGKWKVENNKTLNFELGTLNGYYIGVGRCIPYKKFDLLVDAFNENGKRLILCTATDTPLFRELKARSKPNIEWKYRVSHEEKYALMQHAKAFLFPPEEDFGLVPIEAMAMGTPVIAYAKGGALETVIDGKTGTFFSQQTPEALNETIEKFEGMQFDREIIRQHAEEFSKEVFQRNIIVYISSKL